MQSESRPPSRSRPRLTWTDGAGSHSVEVDVARTAGSADGCQLVVQDKAVSRIHFEVDPQSDGLWVRDLGSRNGTFVNGVMVGDARVPAGSVIRVGQTDMTVAYTMGPGEAPSTEVPFFFEELTPASFGSLATNTAPLRAVFEVLAALASTDRSILLEGESGSGKKALARAIHDASPRAALPFVVVECAALPEDPAGIAEQLEDALSQAEGGTLVLDDPASLPLAVQRELMPPIDAKAFRLVITTERDLRRLVNQGAFRENLYFRIASATVRVPPLRERPADLAFLLTHFLGEAPPAALLEDLARLPWMGNVRELQHYASRLAKDRAGAALAAHLDAADTGAERSSSAAMFSSTLEAPALRAPGGDLVRMLPIALEPWFLVGFKEFRERWIDLGEREYLRRLMQRTNRSSGTASREAGLERTYLYRLLKKHGV